MDPALEKMRRFRLDLAYDGRGFAGWQSQACGGGIQDLLSAALRGICPAVAGVQGSGRTDAGVSATGQVAHFDAPGDWRMSGGEWQRALNAKLPATVRVTACAEAPPSFHSRFSALGKTYRYEIRTGEVLPPLRAGLAWHQRGLGPAEELAGVLSLFEGRHDFRAFSAKRRDGRDETRDTVRTLHAAAVEDAGAETLVLRFSGDGFLYKMVRFLVGSAAWCLRGRVAREELAGLLERPGEHGAAPYCAPPDGLLLEEVRYPPEFAIPE